jgi:hypothetical protein
MENHQDPSFSVNEFRSWLSKHNDSNKSKSSAARRLRKGGGKAGMKVESRLGSDRLESKVAEFNPGLDAAEVAEAFLAAGGEVVQTEGLNVTVRAGDHTFAVPFMYLKQQKGDR